ncbi:MAG: hypothetical protein ABI693_16765 [Bryobacteraceae bacterium]
MANNIATDDQATRGPISRSASLVLKGIAVLLLYALLGRPSAYVALWERGSWYVLLLAVPVVPLLLVWSVEVLVWRVRINESNIEIRSPRGVLKRRICEISRLDRAAGRLLLAFQDGSKRTVPVVVGDLEGLLNEIETRRHHRDDAKANRRLEYDAAIGLDYFGARYFSGAQGRFTSPDSSAILQAVPTPI